MKLYDRHGTLVPVGTKLGSGGEGVVFAVNDHRKLAAKVYHQGISTQKAEKLARIAAAATPPLLDLAAWPVDVLHESPGGRAIGLLMPRIDGFKPIHLLYGPKSRQQEFPEAQWPFLVNAATNIARAFEAVHGHGHVVGDVNHGNMLVNDKGIVKFIDCDSFQIYAGGRHYLCEVGVATHTPPELQEMNFRSGQRTSNHDGFGLAVVLFQMLMMGRHPFSGAYIGKGEMPLEQAIKEHRFAYGAGASLQLMKQPPGTPSLETLGPAATLFERAFASGGARPTATEWRDALKALQAGLVPCRDNRSHHHLRGLTACPWCAAERQTGMVFFLVTAANLAASSTALDVTAIWARICSLKPPVAPAIPLPSTIHCKPNEWVSESRMVQRFRYFLGWAIAIAGVMLAPMAEGAAGFMIFGSIILGYIVGCMGSEGP